MIKGILNFVVVVEVEVWLLQGFGVIGSIGHIWMNDIHFN
jgi:hypothetical protein